jgi:acyl-CoA thioester hydrolase
MEKRAYKIQVRFVDIDVMGHVNNAVYLNYFEQARMMFFADLVGKQWDWVNNGLVLARNEVNYKEPVLLNDDVYISIWCTKIGTKSFDLSYELMVTTPEGDRVKANGVSVLVCFDYKTKQTIEVPELWRSVLVVN